LHVLSWSVGRLPGVKTAIEVSHIGVAHVLKGVRGQGRSTAPSAVQNEAPTGVELRPVVGTSRVGPKLEHAPRSMYCTGDRAVLLPLAGFAEVDDERISSFDLFCHLINRQILDPLLCFRYQIRCRLRHCWLLSHGRSPWRPIARFRPYEAVNAIMIISNAAIIAAMPGVTAPQPPIRTLLVANRGEIAVRVIRAAHDLGIRAVAVYGEGEREAMHVRLANDAWCIPSTAPISYLDIPAIVEIAHRSGADAIHPGYGFLAENPEFAQASADAGIVFVGPPAAAIAAMGDKIRARQIAATAGIPVVPGSDGPVASPIDALAWGAENGYPVAVKASGGGGGRGFRIARGPEEMEAAYLGASGEAARSFANPEVYLERYLDDPRHIEVQLMADVQGQIIAVGDRDCSVQRRHQKLIEEAPAPRIPEETRKNMAEAAVALARAVAYRGAGTVEFLLDANGQFAFLEMNTRIQVEHPVTEMTTGIDLVREQILVAGGAPLSFTPEDVAPRGHALECRINAEDPGKGFAPAPGTISRFQPPAGMGVRVDSAAESGSRIHPAYDSLIAKVITWGRDRDEAASRMRRALIELDIAGVPTTREFHLRLLDHPDWQRGAATTTFLDRHPEVLPPPADAYPAVETRDDGPVEVVAEVDGHRFEVRVYGKSKPATSNVPLQRPNPPAKPNTDRTGDDALLRSPIQGTVVRVAVGPGDSVLRGQTVCVIEAMKMENDVTAHRDGVLATVAATPGMAVRVGDPIAEIT
jgi:acetyl-CoA/propionyl-CoA carboxylase, biotin carboxylase, biotin carboxyl carrier protein